CQCRCRGPASGVTLHCGARSGRPRGRMWTTSSRPLPYQFEVIEQIGQAIAAGQRRILVTLPTGAGKTVCAADIIRRFKESVLFSLFLAHRREIIGQTSQRLTEHGMPLGAHGIIMAERMCDLRPQARVQVASIDTLHARGVRTKTMEL